VLDKRRRSLKHLKEVQFLVSFKLGHPLKKIIYGLFDKISLIVLKLLVIWWSENLLHLDNLNSLSLSWEHWGFGEELKNDASGCPNIDGEIILVASQDQFWSPVVTGDHVRSIHARRALVQDFRAADVTNPHLLVLQKNVLRLQVSVGDSELVHVLESDENLSGILFDHVHGEEFFLSLKVLQNILERHVTKFENSILDDPLLVIQGVKKVKELNHVVLASQHVKNFKLSRDDVSRFLSSLKCDFALSVLAKSFENISESSISDDSNWRKIGLLVLGWVLVLIEN
jgi:hypothetical protein